MKPTGFPGSLSPLQQDLLRAFDPYGEGFFLTGGGALAGFYGSDRPTRDLDLFTRDKVAYQTGREALTAAAAELSCKLEPVRAFPHFQRYLVQRKEEQLVIDLVKEEVDAVHSPLAPEGWTLAVDSLAEIAVNKICAMIGRGETRDLEDLAFLAKLDVDLERALSEASLKDGGVGPDTLLLGLRSYPTVEPDTELGRFRDAWIRSLQQGLLPP